jgi:hypothetical protein
MGVSSEETGVLFTSPVGKGLICWEAGAVSVATGLGEGKVTSSGVQAARAI